MRDKQVSQFFHEDKLAAIFHLRIKYAVKKDWSGGQPSRIQQVGNSLNISDYYQLTPLSFRHSSCPE